ncbi:MAG: class I SAM-dependent methyltransferase [Myxococcota bacterium]
MDPRRRFTATVDRYDRYRPDYPEALVDALSDLAVGAAVVELGAGTGILSRQLAARGLSVTAVEPNEAMRTAGAAHADSSGVRWVAGSAEQTGLAAASADLVVGAQAFHWFDLDRALPEIDRLLVPGAWAVAAWNDRVEHGFAAAYDEVLLAWSDTYADVPRPGPTLEALEARRPEGRRLRFPHRQVLDLDGVIGRAWSSSYVVHGVSDRQGFDDALQAAFRAHALDGRVDLAYETVAWAWPRREP